MRTDLVTIPLVVTDSHGHRIEGLKVTDFLLADSGRPVRIDYFASGAERVALAFLLDNSNSLSAQLIRQRDAALGLFSRFGPGSSVSVIKFGQQAKVMTPFTTDTETARAGFDIHVNTSERTAIFDAANAAIQTFAARGWNSTERRIVVLISDGLDTASMSTAPSTIAAANQANISFYIIQLPLFTPREGRLVPRSAVRGFRDLAEKTGGKYFIAGTVESALKPATPVDLTQIFGAIEEDLRSNYMLGFYPAEALRDGQNHSVSVTLSNRNNKFKVRQAKSTYSVKPT